MGRWFARAFSKNHEVGVYDIDSGKLSPHEGYTALKTEREIQEFGPELLLNCVSLHNITTSFRETVGILPSDCLLGDVASVKGDLAQFYQSSGHRFVSIHPMFGPTFADIDNLENENAVIIEESDREGKIFFAEFFKSMGVNVFEYSFASHDQMMAYSLTLPFVSSMVFSSCVSTNAVPGTTFRKHLEVAEGLLSEDDSLLAEIIFNPHSLSQLETITGRLNFLWHIVKSRDTQEAYRFFETLRRNLHPES